jgi:hypothetical protein
MRRSYKEREDELFERWMQVYRDRDGINPEEDFAFDGVLYRGEYVQVGGCWERKPGNETQLWDSSRCRLLILTKDTTRSSGMDDVRIETARKNPVSDRVAISPTPFYRNLTLWSYALMNALQGGEIVDYDQLPDWEQLREHYASAAIARVNCKKSIGASSIENDELESHIERYSEFLREQLVMYDADVILCCGGGGIIKDFVRRCYLPDLVPFSTDDWVYYSPSTRKVVINSYHPTFPKGWKTIEESYRYMMADVRNFLESFPEYVR